MTQSLVPWICALVYCACSLDSNYELVDADIRNIIFVGRSRAGKSTAIEVLKDKDHDPALFSIIRGTADASMESFTVSSKKHDKDLHFNIMDTPGLFERVETDDQRTNEVILDVIKKCIDMEITKIHHVYYVMSIQHGLSEEDLKSFDLFTDLFVGMEWKISIILSFSQETSKKNEAHYIEQFEHKVPALKSMYHKIGRRIFFLGAVQQSEYVNVEALQKNVYRQRAVLFEHIIGEADTFNVKKLQIYRDNLSLVRRARRILNETCRITGNCEDLPKFDAFIAHYNSEDDVDENEKIDDASCATDDANCETKDATVGDNHDEDTHSDSNPVPLVDMSEDCDYELVDADIRNIIFVGRSRAGKSTTIDVLKDKDHDPALFSILRGTKSATVSSFTMNSKSLDNKLHFNIMDTPGLFERVEKDDGRTNEVILDVIKKCIDMEITKIHHVYYVMSVQYGLSEEDLKSFDLFTELFVGMEEKISIILSFSQETSKEQEAHYIDQFQHKVPALKPMFNKIGGRIYFLGAVKQSEYINEEALKKNVYRQRAVLFEHVVEQNETFNVKKLKVYRDHLSLIKRVRTALVETCKCRGNCIDLRKWDSFISHYDPDTDADDHYGDSNQDDVDIDCTEYSDSNEASPSTKKTKEETPTKKTKEETAEIQHDELPVTEHGNESDNTQEVMLKIGGAFISLAVLIVGIVLFRYAVQNKTV